jgi:hypothetical protein
LEAVYLRDSSSRASDAVRGSEGGSPGRLRHEGQETSFAPKRAAAARGFTRNRKDEHEAPFESPTRYDSQDSPILGLWPRT